MNFWEQRRGLLRQLSRRQQIALLAVCLERSFAALLANDPENPAKDLYSRFLDRAWSQIAADDLTFNDALTTYHNAFLEIADSLRPDPEGDPSPNVLAYRFACASTFL